MSPRYQKVFSTWSIVPRACTESTWWSCCWHHWSRGIIDRFLEDFKADARDQELGLLHVDMGHFIFHPRIPLLLWPAISTRSSAWRSYQGTQALNVWTVHSSTHRLLMAHWDSSFIQDERLSQGWRRQIELFVSANILLQVVNKDDVSGTPTKHKSELLLFNDHYFTDVESSTYSCSFMTWSVSLRPWLLPWRRTSTLPLWRSKMKLSSQYAGIAPRLNSRGGGSRGQQLEGAQRAHHLTTQPMFLYVFILHSPVSRVQAHQNHCIHNSHQHHPGLCSPSVWHYRTHHHQLKILWWISLFLPQNLPARHQAWSCAWANVGSLRLLGLTCLPSLLQGCCRLWTIYLVQLCPPVYSTTRFQASVDGSWKDFGVSIQHSAIQLWPRWLHAICSISIGTSCGGKVSHSSHVFLTDWNWLEVAGSLGFQAQMWGENLRFFTQKMKSHINMWCCFMHPALLTTLLTFQIMYLV